MIIATVITCPQRWASYQRMRKEFEKLGFGFPLRTFQTEECLGNPYANNNLNARAALAFCHRHLPEQVSHWVLYLEDDVRLSSALPRLLPLLTEYGNREGVDCWYLCNRKNHVEEQFRVAELVINRLAWPVYGAHGLLIPRRHLGRMLAAHWSDVSDQAMFAAIRHPGLTILQVVNPVLIEHLGEYSTYAPTVRKRLEVNHAD